jgi:nucleotide-binding universal stress UspA family protein
VAQAAALVESSIGGVPLDPELIEETIETDEHEARTYLEHLANEPRRKGLRVETETPEGSAVEVIVERARSTRADLIALTTHGNWTEPPGIRQRRRWRVAPHALPGAARPRVE